MTKLISQCPSCQAELEIASLKCPDCGMELKSAFELSPFDKLGGEQYNFLLSFLRCRGNLKSIQNELQISYPTAKKQLDELLIDLKLIQREDIENTYEESIDVKFWNTDYQSTKASEIIKSKLKDCGGRAVVHTATGLPREIVAAPDGVSFFCDKLPKLYGYDVFDVIVDLLLANNGRAKKGNGRKRLGDPECDENTVVGAIGLNYEKKQYGDAVNDPVFVLAAVLEWAEIAHNGRGELVLTQSYRSKL